MISLHLIIVQHLIQAIIYQLIFELCPMTFMMMITYLIQKETVKWKLNMFNRVYPIGMSISDPLGMSISDPIGMSISDF